MTVTSRWGTPERPFAGGACKPVPRAPVFQNALSYYTSYTGLCCTRSGRHAPRRNRVRTHETGLMPKISWIPAMNTSTRITRLNSLSETR